MNVIAMRAAMLKQIDADDPAGEAAIQGVPAVTSALVHGSKAFAASRSARNSTPKVGSSRSRSTAAKRRMEKAAD